MVQEVFVDLVEEYKNEIPIKHILKLFGFSKSSYYRWKEKYKEETVLSEYETSVINLCTETKFEYGYRNIAGMLRTDGSPISVNTVQRIMQKYRLQCQVKPKRQTLYKGKESVVANNIINRQFSAERPLEKLVTDITYLPWGEKRLYLSSIMDLYDGQIIAYTISDIQDIDFVTDTLNQLPELEDPCILHSDQGSVYTSKPYQSLVHRKSITMSMSRKGTPADNAPIESFHSVLKSETFYRYPELKSSTEIISQTVINFIQHYNNTRIQRKLGFMSPVQYRESRILA